MQQRTCPVCGNSFLPATANQTYCPPTERDRSVQSQAKSSCARRAANSKQRGADLTAPLPSSYECAQCGQPCAPGRDVVAHASRFCQQQCKAEWHRNQARADKLLASFFTETGADRTAYRRALKQDPCSYCDNAGGALDHIIPRCTGGPDGFDNRTGACRSCNSSKQRSPLLIFLAWKTTRDEFAPWRDIVTSIHREPQLAA